MAADLFPVFSVDPNGPWKTVEGINCLIVGVRDPDLQKDLDSGEISSGDTVILFQPNEIEGQRFSEEGWGSVGKMVGYTHYEDELFNFYHVYLDVDPKEKV